MYKQASSASQELQLFGLANGHVDPSWAGEQPHRTSQIWEEDVPAQELKGAPPEMPGQVQGFEYLVLSTLEDPGKRRPSTLV